MKRVPLTIFLAALAASPAEPATVVARPSPLVALPGGREVIEFRGCRRIEKGDQYELVFAQEDADTRQIRLVFEARFDWSGLGGYAPGLRLSINGQPLVGARLLNKPLRYRTRNGGGNRWAAPDRASYFVMYSADFSDEIQTNTEYLYGLYEPEQEPYRFVLDLTGLTQHGGDNRAVLRASWLPLVLRNVRIEFDEKSMPRINDPAAVVGPAPSGPLPDFRLRPTAPPALSLRAAPNGAFAAESGALLLPISSRFSRPGGRWLEISARRESVKIAAPYERGWTTPEYTVKRRVEIVGGHIAVSDTFTNLRDEITGVMFENTLCLPREPQSVLFGGLEVMLAEVRNSANPSVGAQLGEDFAALLREDDVFRTQGYMRRSERAIAIGSRNLGLPPKGSQTLAWSIYIVPEAGYYDFINAVRRDWKSNYTCDGPFSFPYGAGCDNGPFRIWTRKPIPQETVDDFLAKRPVKHIITHVASDYSVSPRASTREKSFLGHGTAILGYKWWGDMTRNMTAAFQAYAPQVQVHAYLHKNLCNEPGNREIYADCRALDASSRKLSDTGVFARYVPTVKNAYGKRLSDTYRYLVEDLNTHIYMDEICVGVTAWERYEEWDQCTVAIDPATHRVRHILSIPNLLTKPWLEEMLAYLKAKGRGLIANGPPVTRTLQNHQALHFVEQGMGRSGLIAAHLTSPLAFCYATGTRGYRHFREALGCGALCFLWSGDWSEHIFPFTPLEVRPGYLICQERIVTRLSGRFGWNDASAAEVFVYDGEGKRTSGSEVTVVQEARTSVFEVRMPTDHVAIIVRKSVDREHAHGWHSTPTDRNVGAARLSGSRDRYACVMLIETASTVENPAPFRRQATDRGPEEG